MTSKSRLRKTEIKICSYYNLENLININNIVLKNLKIVKKLNINILSYYTEYEASYSVTPLTFMSLLFIKLMNLLKIRMKVNI